MTQLRIEGVDPLAGGHIAQAQSLMLVYWCTNVGVRDPDTIRRVGQSIHQRHGTLATMMLIERDAPVPDRASRQALAAAWRDTGTSGVATIFLAQGLMTAIGKTIMNAIGMMSHTRDLFRTFNDTREAALWLSQRCPHSPGQLLTVTHGFIADLRERSNAGAVL